jgi:hypothetical protein
MDDYWDFLARRLMGTKPRMSPRGTDLETLPQQKLQPQPFSLTP